MGRMKRKSTIIEKASKRLAGLKAIDPTMDFGGGLTVAGFEAQLNSTRAMLDDYNQKMTVLDDLLNSLVKNEKELTAQYTRTLSAVAARFGKDSSQYEQIGGTRSSERKKPVRGARKAAAKSE